MNIANNASVLLNKHTSQPLEEKWTKQESLFQRMKWKIGSLFNKDKEVLKQKESTPQRLFKKTINWIKRIPSLFTPKNLATTGTTVLALFIAADKVDAKTTDTITTEQQKEFRIAEALKTIPATEMTEFNKTVKWDWAKLSLYVHQQIKTNPFFQQLSIDLQRKCIANMVENIAQMGDIANQSHLDRTIHLFIAINSTRVEFVEGMNEVKMSYIKEAGMKVGFIPPSEPLDTPKEQDLSWGMSTPVASTDNSDSNWAEQNEPQEPVTDSVFTKVAQNSGDNDTLPNWTPGKMATGSDNNWQDIEQTNLALLEQYNLSNTPESFNKIDYLQSFAKNNTKGLTAETLGNFLVAFMGLPLEQITHTEIQRILVGQIANNEDACLTPNCLKKLIACLKAIKSISPNYSFITYNDANSIERERSLLGRIKNVSIMFSFWRKNKEINTEELARAVDAGLVNRHTQKIDLKVEKNWLDNVLKYLFSFLPSLNPEELQSLSQILPKEQKVKMAGVASIDFKQIKEALAPVLQKYLTQLADNDDSNWQQVIIEQINNIIATGKSADKLTLLAGLKEVDEKQYQKTIGIMANLEKTLEWRMSSDMVAIVSMLLLISFFVGNRVMKKKKTISTQQSASSTPNTQRSKTVEEAQTTTKDAPIAAKTNSKLKIHTALKSAEKQGLDPNNLSKPKVGNNGDSKAPITVMDSTMGITPDLLEKIKKREKAEETRITQEREQQRIKAEQEKKEKAKKVAKFKQMVLGSQISNVDKSTLRELEEDIKQIKWWEKRWNAIQKNLDSMTVEVFKSTYKALARYLYDNKVRTTPDEEYAKNILLYSFQQQLYASFSPIKA